MKRPIAIGLSPNTQKEDVLLALRLFFVPWRYVHGSAAKELERWFRTFFKVSNAIAFVNARSALYAILHNLEVSKGDEVVLQAFTCVAVPNAVIATGAKPVYVDVGDDYNINPDLIEKKITKKTKAIIVQHTFGIPAEMDKIVAIAKKNNLLLIEDCAHTIGGEYKNEKLGTFGIASCFSFGREKAFSSVFGGIAITTDTALGQKLRSYQKQKSLPLFPWVIQQLWYPIISGVILNLYYVLYIGKIFHFILRRFSFFTDAVTQKEKKGEFNPRDVKRFPNSLASLALMQIRKQKQYNQTRQDIVTFYKDSLSVEISYSTKAPLLRFPLSVADKKKCIAYFAKRGIYIGSWYNQVIDPRGVNLEKIFYKQGSCPKAESLTRTLINLPTYPTMSIKDAERVVGVFKDYQRSV